MLCVQRIKTWIVRRRHRRSSPPRADTRRGASQVGTDKVENTVLQASNRSLPYLQPGTARTIRFKLLRIGAHPASDDLTELSLP